MVLGKRKSYGRRPASRRPLRRRRVAVTRSVRTVSTQLYQFKRKFFLETWSPSNISTNDFWRRYNFTLNSMPDFGELVALFDQYKMNAIKLEFRPRYDSFAGENTTDTTLPGVTNQTGALMHVSHDIMSTVNPSGTYSLANLNAFMTTSRIKTYSGTRPFTVYFKPVINQTIAGDQNFNYRRTTFLPTNASVNHLHTGPNVFTQAQTGSFAGPVWGQSWDIFVTMYVTCKNLK